MGKNAVWWKAQILSNGITIDDSVIKHYDQMYIEKRSAYGIQDPDAFRAKRVPQEIIILPDKLICAVNICSESPYTLKYSTAEHKYFVEATIDKEECLVTFPIRPAFYNQFLNSIPSMKVNQIISLYGGHSLGAFLHRNCWFEEHGVCHFCSLCNNHGANNDFMDDIGVSLLEESLSIALSEDYPFTQIMLNGGNIPDLDENFLFYTKRALAVKQLLTRLCRLDIELHLITSPPRDLSLIDTLYGSNIKLSFNMETYDDHLFSVYCPGKNTYIGHDQLKRSLRKAVDVLGFENVYSIFVGGLEPELTLEKGIKEMIDSGIIPVINVLHVDPHTKMQQEQRPSPEFILKAGALLQKAYSKLTSNFLPFYYRCGRNSLDTEAYLKLFY